MLGNMIECDALVLVEPKQGIVRGTAVAQLLREQSLQVQVQSSVADDFIPYKSLVIFLTSRLLDCAFVHRQMRRCATERKPYCIVFEERLEYGGVEHVDGTPMFPLYSKNLPSDLQGMLRKSVTMMLHLREPQVTIMLERIKVINRIDTFISVKGKKKRKGKKGGAKLGKDGLETSTFSWRSRTLWCATFIILAVVAVPILILVLTYTPPSYDPEATAFPTKSPTKAPTKAPTGTPTQKPTMSPTFSPTFISPALCLNKSRSYLETLTISANSPGSSQRLFSNLDAEGLDIAVGMEVQLLGAGGGGGTSSGGSTVVNSYGGPGAYVFARFPFFRGLNVTFEIGRGGIPQQASRSYPDGGAGSYLGGSGGGSTRMYIEDELIAVAAGGGGAGFVNFTECEAGTPAHGGAGGGLYGMMGSECAEFFPNGYPSVNGGTQISPGPGGASLLGASPLPPFYDANGTWVNGTLGCGGGGGGWMGGGAGEIATGGGGGSSRVVMGFPYGGFDIQMLGNQQSPISSTAGVVYPPDQRLSISIVSIQPLLGTGQLAGPGGDGVVQVRIYTCV